MKTEGYYKAVADVLDGYCQQIKNGQAMIEQKKNAYQMECVKLDGQLRESLQVNEERKKKLKAYIDIAASDTSKYSKQIKPSQYDEKKLSKLAVQINGGSPKDSFALQLYLEAMGQMKFVESQTEELQIFSDQKKGAMWNVCQSEIQYLKEEEKKVLSEMRAYLSSETFKSFCQSLRRDYAIFCSPQYKRDSAFHPDRISIGTVSLPMWVPEEIAGTLKNLLEGNYDVKTGMVEVPLKVNIAGGKPIVIDYCNEKEAVLLSGLQNFLLNIAKYCENVFHQIVFFDPVRCNNSAVGCLSRIATGANAFMDMVPMSLEEIRKKVTGIISNQNHLERQNMQNSTLEQERRILIFHNFPQAYDSALVSQIRQLCVNAVHNNMIVILTHNVSTGSTDMGGVMTYLKTISMYIACNNGNFELTSTSETPKYRLSWYPAPASLPTDIVHRFIDKKPVVDMSNDYMRRVGLGKGQPSRKGKRKLTGIPYGVDENGNLLFLDFENSNFATFICGASRSGKSTLLHTLITGIIQNNHPDDVEIWLVDFKMTEFSRYIEHTPPHIRYIILDESPELVYDLLDRLTEILTKRQNIFKGKWLKLDEVPGEKYMPAILVIIDEFSVMSQIVADSITNSKENYSVKLQALLAKGAALGLHFIFASQGFTSGTRGLNDFSKKQIQQRIAMKTEFNEIKETLDLKSASDDDKAMMEQLPVHHTLVRIPVNDRGNHLQQSKVLVLSDYSKQEDYIDRIRKQFVAKQVYELRDPVAYIDKKTMILDGNTYTTFVKEKKLMLNYLCSRASVYEQDGVDVFIGQPRRMMPLYPIGITNGYSENILLLASNDERMPAVSVIMSVVESLRMQKRGAEVWGTRGNSFFRQLVMESRQPVTDTKTSLDSICNRIRQLRGCIEKKEPGNHFFVLLGYENLVMDMSYQNKTFENDSGRVYEKRKPGMPDLNEKIKLLSMGTDTVAPKNADPVVQKEENTFTQEDTQIYDAREDFKFVLTHGPRLGYHFMMVFSSVGEWNQVKIDASLLKHKILFKMSKNDAMTLIGSAAASSVAELDDHSYRYSNGLDTLSFRPYLHYGLSWDGWRMDEKGEVITTTDEEYLL